MERVEYKRDNHLLKGGEGGRKVFIYSKVNYLENLDTLYEKKTTGFDGKFPFLPLFVTLRTAFVYNIVHLQLHSCKRVYHCD